MGNILPLCYLLPMSYQPLEAILICNLILISKLLQLLSKVSRQHNFLWQRNTKLCSFIHVMTASLSFHICTQRENVRWANSVISRNIFWSKVQASIQTLWCTFANNEDKVCMLPTGTKIRYRTEPSPLSGVGSVFIFKPSKEKIQIELRLP